MDLTYTQDKLFTRFMPQTTDGENAWREIANQTNGSGAVFNHQAAATLSQLRKAGYKVGKAKPATKKEMGNMFAEFDELFV